MVEQQTPLNLDIRRALDPEMAVEWHGALSTSLSEQGDIDPGHTEKVLFAAERMGLLLISGSELRRFYKYLRITPTQSDIDKLRQHVLGALPESAAIDLTPPVKPAVILPHPRRKNSKSLVVAHDPQTLHERREGRRAIRGYYGLSQKMKGVWDEDGFAVRGLRIAMSRSVEEEGFLRCLMSSINGHNILGETATLKPVE